jgi:predicted ATPase
MTKELELLRRIGAFPENEAHLRDLVTQVQTNHGVVPFVGAGLSMPLFPGWTKFLQELGESAGSATLTAVNQQLGSGRYEEAAELVQTKLGSRRFQEHLEDTFGDHRLPEQPISGAVTSIPRIASGVVITTNFDRLLERTFAEAGTPTRHVWGRDALERGGRHLQREESVLLKLHGDYETSSGRVLTLKDYQQCYGNAAGCAVDANLPIPSLLMAILATRSLLFVGCSLAADRTVPLLQHIANRFTNNVQFAIVSLPASEEDFQERARLLSEMGIRPIWYPTNRHELVRDILEHLAAARGERPKSKLSGPTTSAATATATAKGNAPRPTTPLVGRQAELSTLDRMLDACRMITIAGGPGTGKTRVAIELARRVESRFPLGVWFVELDSLREARLVPQRIANVLGIREQSSEPPQESLALHIGDRDVLVVLDNAEHVVEACSQTASFLIDRCPNLRLVLTSRAVTKTQGEYVYTLWPLGAPEEVTDIPSLRQIESVMLFLDRAKARRPDFDLSPANASAIATICRTLDGIPLALQLAAGRIGVLSVQEIADRLLKGFSDLRRGREGDHRHWETLTAALEWSYGLLNEEQRRFLLRISVFDGGWVREAAATVGIQGPPDEDQAIGRLEDLINQSLVVSNERDGRMRYRLLEPVRQFALAKLEQSGGAAECRRLHAEWFLGFTEQTEPLLVGESMATALSSLATEIDNLRAAMRWALANGRTEHSLRLASGLWRFSDIRGHFREGRERLVLALAMPSSEEHPIQLSKALSGAGMLAYRQSDYDAASGLFEQSLAIERRRNDPKGIANSLNDLGIVAMRRGALERAAELLAESLAMERQLGHTRGVGVALFNLGYVAFQRGDLATALTHLTHSCRTFESIGDHRDLAFPTNTLALVALLQRDFSKARQLAEQSQRIRTDLSDKRGLAETQRTLALVSLEMGERGAARIALLESMKGATGVGDSRGVIETLEFLGVLASRCEDHTHAVRLLGASSAFRSRSGIPSLPFELGLTTQALEKAKATLGDSRYQNRWNEGSEWPPNTLTELMSEEITGI